LLVPGILLMIQACNRGSEEAHVGRRKRHNDSQKRAAGRVRGRVQQRTNAKRADANRRDAKRTDAKRTDAKRGGEPRRGRNTPDLGAIEGYANRLAGNSRGIPDLSGTASGLAGAASGLAGGGFASRLFSGDASMPEENFRKEVAARFSLIEERLQRLEEQASDPVEPDAVENPPPPESTAGPEDTLQ
jgi:hypothetical protein